ncbi:hypothetical protein [Methylophaga sp.]|jgi:hypothetical protein|uniref:hypothetical protein n=1 Tax=Methylophaga sp. TaxID=2024840 RepID=UPI0027250D87|nr:hypothetical protein [Methylophaga sp.]MDO8826548.1 hypothetical protein [Methylophaga sp.]
MLNRMRLIFTGLFLSMALIACSNESDTAVTDSGETETTAPATVESAPEAAEATGDSANAIQAGMSRDELISAYGEPDIAQERTLDQMNMETLEWHNDDALIIAQLLDGKVTYGRIVPKSE